MKQLHTWPGGQRVCPQQPLRKGTTRLSEGEVRPDFTKSNDVALRVTAGTRAPRLFQEPPAGPGFPSSATCPMVGKLAAWGSILGPTQLCRPLGTRPPASPWPGWLLSVPSWFSCIFRSKEHESFVFSIDFSTAFHYNLVHHSHIGTLEWKMYLEFYGLHSSIAFQLETPFVLCLLSLGTFSHVLLEDNTIFRSLKLLGFTLCPLTPYRWK